MNHRIKFQKAFQVYSLVKQVVDNPDKILDIEEVKKKVEEIKNPNIDPRPEPGPAPQTGPSHEYEKAKLLAEGLEQRLNKNFAKVKDTPKVRRFMQRFSEPEWFLKELDKAIKFFEDTAPPEPDNGDVQLSLPLSQG